MLEHITRIRTDLDIAKIPDVFARFRDLVDERYWQKQVVQIREKIRRNRFLGDLLAREYEIVIEFDAASNLARRYGKIPVAVIDCRYIYPAMAFAAQVLSIVDSSSSSVGKRLIGRVCGAIQNPDDMRGLRLELVAATHFTRRGHCVLWPENHNLGTMDLLIEDLGPSGLEVECKAISDDIGRKITRGDARNFWHLMYPRLKPLADRMNTGLALVVTIPDRLPTVFKAREMLARAIASSVIAGQASVAVPGATLRMMDFDSKILDSTSGGVDMGAIRPIVDQITRTENREIMLVGKPQGGAIAVVLQSAKDDKFLQKVFRTLSESASRQLSKTRGCLYLVGFDGLDAQSLLSIAAQDADPGEPPTSLALQVSKFLSKETRDHVVGVGFLSRSALHPHNAAAIEDWGSTYLFPKKESPFWHSDFDGLFRPR